MKIVWKRVVKAAPDMYWTVFVVREGNAYEVGTTSVKTGIPIRSDEVLLGALGYYREYCRGTSLLELQRLLDKYSVKFPKRLLAKLQRAEALRNL